MTEEPERQFTVPWTPLIGAGRPIIGEAYQWLWRVAHAIAYLGERRGGATITSLDVARFLDMPHLAVRGAYALLVELEVIERDGADIVVHFDRAPCEVTLDDARENVLPLAVDFDANERAFAAVYPEDIAELEQLIRDGKLGREQALADFRRLCELADAVEKGELSDEHGGALVVQLALGRREPGGSN